MQKFYNFLLVLGLPALFLILTSEMMFPSGSPGGKSGSPGDNGANCTDCHSGTTANQEGWIISPLMQVMGYSPNETYSIILAGYDESAQLYGFEITAEDDGGNKVGSFLPDVLGFTQLINNSTAVTHTVLGTTPITDSAIWLINWTAPATTVGNITFYAAVNAANGNGSTSGDQVYLTHMTASPSTSIADRNAHNALGIYPNPSDGRINLDIERTENGQQLEVMNLTGQLVYSTEAVRGKNSMDLGFLQKGIYIVRMGKKSQRIILR
jgi:hypothetical protein